MKIVTIKENSDFKRAYYKGKSVIRKRIVVYYRKNRLNVTRLGITVSTKVGKAVLRNKIRRFVRESFRLLPGKINGYDIVIVARRASAFASFCDINKDMESALNECSLLKRDDPN